MLDDDPLEIELAATLLYQCSHHPYRQIREVVAALPESQRREIIDLGLRHRGRHDEVARTFCAGQRFRFDILMDIGGFRDMHRHRRCVQIVQEYTTAHGYDEPVEIASAGLAQRYEAAMEGARDTAAQLGRRTSPTLSPSHPSETESGTRRGPRSGERACPELAEGMGHPGARVGDEAAEQSQYVIPLAFRKRTLFKMDLAEAIYISELRTGVAGHFSYRNVAYAMYEAVAQRCPALAKYFRVTDVREPVDLLKR